MLARCLLAVVCQLCLLGGYCSWSVAEELSDDMDDLPRVTFHLRGIDGQPLGEAFTGISDGWTSQLSYAESSLILRAHGAPLEAGGRLYINSDHGIAVCEPGTAHRMPWPLYPNGSLLSANFSDGTVAVLRLPEAYGAAGGSAELRGESVELIPISAQAFALWQMLGGEPSAELLDRTEWPADSWIAEADTRSLAASASGREQEEALRFAGQAVARMLAEYQAAHGSYPAALAALWQGNTRVAPLGPHNPYNWPEPLCALPLPGTPGLAYTPLSGAGETQGSGYLLGVLHLSGTAVLPAGVNLEIQAPPALEWLYQAPGEGGSLASTQAEEAGTDEEGEDEWQEYLRSSPGYFVAYNDSGHILVEGGMELNNRSWTSIGAWTDSWTVFQPPAADAAVLENGGKTFQPCDYAMVAAQPEAMSKLPALHPSGEFYKADFGDGTRVVLRLPDGSRFAQGKARWNGAWQDFSSMAHFEYAAWVFGNREASPEPAVSEMDVDGALAEADCRSLLASMTSQGKREALLVAAEAVNLMLAEFHKQHGFYPIALSHLAQGNLAIASVAPGNPYFWPESLLDDLRPKTATEPGLVYIGLGESDGGPVVNTGYALGVIGPGEPDSVPDQVSARLSNPPAAIKWFIGGASPEPF